MRLPVIVGFGGVNAAGRSSFSHAYHRMVIDAVSDDVRLNTFKSLANLMALDGNVSDPYIQQQILAGSLIRKIENGVLDVQNIDYNHVIKILARENDVVSFEISNKQLPDNLPKNWRIESVDDRAVRVFIDKTDRILVPTVRESKVQSAGQLPTGFEPGTLYQSRNHPRGLQMTVYGASDAIRSTGIDWSVIASKVPVDQVSVYAGSGMTQLDHTGNGGMASARFNGKKVTSKMCPLGLAEMPADFINAYILGSMGTTGANLGACASFLYNMRQAIFDIQSGKSRVAIVGGSEAPILPDLIEGFSAMGALASDKALMELDGSDTVDHRRACRPFANNCGFTLGESSQFVVLFDDDLAIELGAQIHGAVSDVFINADGYKKSISAPGVGNYFTVAKAMASIRGLLGEQALREKSFIQAHGTGTPQNRVTESEMLNQAAEVFGIQKWPVSAVKCFLGHSIAVAGGDQLAATLGVWSSGILSGISTIDETALDVSTSNLAFSNQHRALDSESIDAAVINSKGFGGNNASASVIAPHVIKKLLQNKHKGQAWANYEANNAQVQQAAADYDTAMIEGRVDPIYRFDHNVLSGSDIDFTDKAIHIKGHHEAIDLTMQSPYAKWL